MFGHQLPTTPQAGDRATSVGRRGAFPGLGARETCRPVLAAASRDRPPDLPRHLSFRLFLVLLGLLALLLAVHTGSCCASRSSS